MTATTAAPAPAPPRIASRDGPPTIPPAGVPLAFLAAAGVGLIGFGCGLAVVGPTAAEAPQSPEVVATVHLAVLAFLSTAVLGAMHQFVPVISGRRLRSVRLAVLTATLFVPGPWLIALGFASAHPRLVTSGGLVTSLGILLAVVNLSGPLSERGKGTPLTGLRWALAFLVATAAFGVTYALDREYGWFVLLPDRVLAHAHLGLIGWLGLAYAAVAEKLWPMFLLAHRPNARSGALAVRLLPLGATAVAVGLMLSSVLVVTVGAVAVGAGATAHLTSLGGVLRHRRRPLELLHAFVLTSAACLLVAAGAAASQLAPLSYTWHSRLAVVETAALISWLGLAVIGHAHKIVPFIAWSTLRARGITTGPDGSPLLFAHLFHHPTARATFGAATAGVLALLAGGLTGTGALVRIAGVLIGTAGVLAVANLGLGPLRLLVQPAGEAGPTATIPTPAPGGRRQHDAAATAP